MSALLVYTANEKRVQLVREPKVPALHDADVPPVERPAVDDQFGFDPVAFSGGQAQHGPNDTGLLAGRKELFVALAAVERFVRRNRHAERRETERRSGVIEKALRDAATVRCKRVTPPMIRVALRVGR